MKFTNFLLKKIDGLCDEWPRIEDSTDQGPTSPLRARIRNFEIHMEQIRRAARELQGVLNGDAHYHVNGRCVGLSQDTCGVCGHDLRHQIHFRTQPEAPANQSTRQGDQPKGVQP